MYFARITMFTSAFESFFVDSFLSPNTTIYVVSDSQLEELKHKQRQEELENIEKSRRRLEESYRSRIKILDEREHEIQEELKVLSPSIKEKVSS